MASKRVHSLFVLRLFNDCVAMFFAHSAVLASTGHRVRGSAAPGHAGVVVGQCATRSVLLAARC